MGKLKPRIKAGKAKKWRKGQSSSSNPTTSKYREAAKSRFFTPNLGTTRALTVGALKTHNAMMYEGGKSKKKTPTIADEDESDDVTEATTATYNTFASQFSTCSNMSFSKLLNNFQPSSALHKEMLAVLSAVTEVIKSRGGEETTTEYFAALMTALDASSTAESTSAIVSLLLMGIKRVPQEVLRAKFSHISKSLLDILSKYSEGDYYVITRCVIGCVGVVLAAQDATTWSYPSTHQLFHTILVYTTYTKPKVRKVAQQAVTVILTRSPLATHESREQTSHPAAGDAANYCLAKLDEPSGNSVLHILALLKNIISTFPRTQIKRACEGMLKLLTLGNAVLTSCCMETLYGLVSDATPVSRFTPTLNAQLIHALYDYQPGLTDTQAMLAWLSVLHHAYQHLAKIDANLCGENLLKLFTKVAQLWLCDNSKILANATHTLRSVALETLPLCSQCPNFPTIVQNVFSVVEEGLQYQFHNAWPHVLNVLAALFEGLGEKAEASAQGSLIKLADLRDSHEFAYIAELDYAVGRAVRAFGPRLVLSCIPLNITGDERDYEVKRGWLLPILKDNILSAPLNYFTNNILPLALLCRKRSDLLQKRGEKAGAHTYELLCCQLWALLPCFCCSAANIKEDVVALGPTLGTVLQSYKLLRMSVMSGLRKLIQTCKDSESSEGMAIINRYAKNFLPMLFNIYTSKPDGTDEEGQRLAAFDTIKMYLENGTPAELCCELFDKAIPHVTDDAADVFMKTSVLDLLKLLLVKLDPSRVTRLYDVALQLLQLPQKSLTEEKKAYRLLEQLCACKSESCQEVMSSKVADIRKRVLRAVKKQNARNAGARLRVIRLLIRLLPRGSYDMIKSLVPEAVLRCKDNNSRTRACAFDVLIDMFHVSQEWSDKPESDMMSEYVEMLLGGLAGSPSLASATLLALSHVTYTLRNTLTEDVTSLLVESACLLLAEASREIVAAALGFVKTFLIAFPVEKTLRHVPLIVQSLSSMSEDCARHARLKTRDVIDRLMRKFGFDVIKELIPAGDVIMLKRLNNLRKIDQTKRRRADQQSQMDDEDKLPVNISTKHHSIEEMLESSDESDVGEEEEKRDMGRQRERQRGPAMYIREEEDDIVDLTSPAAASKLTVKRLARETPAEKKKKESPFEMTSTGKLVIPRDLADDTSRQRGGKQKMQDDDDDDDEVNDVTSELSSVRIGKKRKMSVASGSVRSGPPTKYQAGGSGIHRVVDTASTTSRMSKSRSVKSGRSSKMNLDAGVKTGQEYRAKKARGDVKIQGKPDPYAYVPLSRKVLNKRNKARAAGRLNKIFKSAVKGAKAGAKLRRNNK